MDVVYKNCYTYRDITLTFLIKSVGFRAPGSTLHSGIFGLGECKCILGYPFNEQLSISTKHQEM